VINRTHEVHYLVFNFVLRNP